MTLHAKRSCATSASVSGDDGSFALEELDGPFVLEGLLAGLERSKIAAFTSLRALLAGVQPIEAGFELSDQGVFNGFAAADRARA